MGFSTGFFTVSKLPPGVKHTAEAVAYVATAMPAGYTARAPPQERNQGRAREQSRGTSSAPRTHAQQSTTKSVYNRSCNLYL